MYAGSHRLFIGRQKEREELLSRLALAKSGQAQFVQLVGEPGIGKTWLAEEVSGWAGQEQFGVHWGRAWELGGAPPFWPWGQLLERATQELEREALLAALGARVEALRPLLPGWFQDRASMEEGSGDPRSRFALYDAAAALLGEVCKRGPLLIVLDDIHAFSHSSLRLLAYLMAHSRSLPLALLATRRDVDAQTSPEVDELLVDLARHMAERKLEGLDALELEEWLSAHGSAKGDIEVLQLRTGGNPLFVDGLLRAGQRGRCEWDNALLPPTIRGAIERRLGHLPPKVREVLEAAAVVRRAFGPRLLAQALEASTAAVLDALHMALIEGLLQRVDGHQKQYFFTHSLFAEVLEAGLSASRRLALHRAVGEALELQASGDLRPVLAELARHFLVVAELDDAPQKGVHYALEAGLQAYRSSDYQAAIASFLRALELMPLEAPTLKQAEARLALADALLLEGRPKEARGHYQQAVRLLQPTEHTRALTRAALGLYRTTDYGQDARESTALLEQLLKLWERDGDEDLQAQILASLSITLWMLPEYAELREKYSAQALALARKQGSDRELAFALSARFQTIWSPDTLEQRATLVEEMQALAMGVKDPVLRLELHRWSLNLHWERCDIARADKALDDYCQVAQELRAPQALMNAALRKATRAQIAGSLDEVYPLLDEIAYWGPRAGDLQTHLYVAYGSLYPLYHQGKADELCGALPLVRESMALWREFPGPAAVLLSSLLMAGRREEAASHYARYQARDFALYRFWGTVHAWVQLAEAALAFEDAQGAAQIYELLLPYARQMAWSGIGLPMGPAALYLGRLARFLDRPTEALDHLATAEALLLQIGDPLHLAFARLELLRVHMPPDAESSLHQLQALAQREGYQVLEERCLSVAESLSPSPLSAPQPVQKPLDSPAPELPTPEIPAPEASVLAKDGASWRVEFAGKTAQIKALRGVEYIARLLEHPGRELHVLELMPSQATSRSDGGIETLDAEAIAAYKKRIAELQEELDEADTWNDLERAERLRHELDALTRELARSVGLGGRTRTQGAHQEKARSAVTRAIKRAQTMIESHHEEFAHHLRNSIKTGVFCSYQPEPGRAVRVEE